MDDSTDEPPGVVADVAATASIPAPRRDVYLCRSPARWRTEVSTLVCHRSLRLLRRPQSCSARGHREVKANVALGPVPFAVIDATVKW